MHNTKNIRLAGFIGAFLSLLILGYTGYQYRRANDTIKQTTALRSQISAIQLRIEQSKDQRLVKDATVLAAPNEEANFISQLKSTAKDTNTTIVKWSVVASDSKAKTSPNNNKGGQNTKEEMLMKDVTSISANLEIEGDYKALLRFTDNLLNSPRLINLNFVSVSRNDDKNVARMSMLVTRYVEQPDLLAMEGQKA